MTAHFHSSGRVSSGGVGIAPLLWAEARAYGLNAGLDAEEIALLRHMSDEFIVGWRRAKDEFARLPWDGH